MSNARNIADLAGDTSNLEAISSAYSAGALSNRNLIINGAMQVWQRGTSRTYKQHDYGTVDRFQPARYQEAAYERATVSGSGPDAQYALRVSSSSTSEAGSGTRMAAGQMVESVNCQHLKGKQVTLSFWVKFSASTFTGYGDFEYQFLEYTASDPSFGTTTTNTTSTSSVTNGSLPTSWTKYTKTITVGETTNTLAVRVQFNTAANTTNNSDLYYDLTEVQLEVGDTATPFEHRSYGQELALCQRYYELIAPPYNQTHAIYFDGSTVVGMHFPFAVTKRASPTCTLTSDTKNFVNYGGGSIVTASSAFVTNNASFYQYRFSGSGLSTGPVMNLGNMSFTADAEL